MKQLRNTIYFIEFKEIQLGGVRARILGVASFKVALLENVFFYM